MSGIDKFFDVADSVLSSVEKVTDAMPDECCCEDEPNDCPIHRKKPTTFKKRSESLVKLNEVKSPDSRNVDFTVRAVERSGTGVIISGESGPKKLPVLLHLDKESWKKLYDAADWFRGFDK